MASKVSIAYRPDIDGLRTVAVLSVLLFHAFPGMVSGGFIGVDVFFVISGFLIGSIIFREFEEGTFSYATFYYRRARRLFPALVVVLGATLGIGWYILLPSELQQLGKHIAAGVGFVANLVYWQEVGYFDSAAEVKPLLHLWSLGVEEQFYIAFPIIVGLLARRTRAYFITIVLLAAASLAYSARAAFLDPTAAFYSPLSRFWELMAGCILAQIYLHVPPNRLPGRSWASLVGTGAILLGVAFIRKSFPFPGILAMVPVIGAFLVIYAGPDQWINKRILSSPAFVAIGRVSYPLYLWHWVLLSYCYIIAGSEPPVFLRMFALALSFVLAWLTYCAVERPIRKHSMPNTAVTASASLMVLLAAGGTVVHQQDGFRSRGYIQPYVSQAESLFSTAHGWQTCSPVQTLSSCWILDGSKAPTVALVGDSHAAHLLDGLLGQSHLRHLNPIVRVRYGCMPFFAVSRDARGFHTCGDEKGMDAELNDVMNTPSVRTILLSGLGYQMAQLNPTVFREAMHRTLEELVRSGKTIVFIIDVPSLSFDPKECMKLRPLQWGQPVIKPCVSPVNAYKAAQADYLRIVDEEKQAFPTVRFIDTAKWFIEGDNILAQLDGAMLYNDRTHLTPYASRYLLRKIGSELFDPFPTAGQGGF